MFVLNIYIIIRKERQKHMPWNTDDVLQLVYKCFVHKFFNNRSDEKFVTYKHYRNEINPCTRQVKCVFFLKVRNRNHAISGITLNSTMTYSV